MKINQTNNKTSTAKTQFISTLIKQIIYYTENKIKNFVVIQYQLTTKILNITCVHIVLKACLATIGTILQCNTNSETYFTNLFSVNISNR